MRGYTFLIFKNKIFYFLVLFEVLAPTSEASTILMKFIDEAGLRPLI